MPEPCAVRTAMRYGVNTLRVAEIAAHQWGVISHAQLVEAGVNRNGIARWITAGRLHRVYPGVFSVGHESLAIEGRLAPALLYAGPGAALYGVTAGWWLGCIVAKPKRLHVVTQRQRRSLLDVRVHRSRNVERVMHKGLPVTPPAQALLDMASGLRFNELRRALAEAEYQKLVTVGEVAAVLGRGKPGSAALGAALQSHLPVLAKTRSRMEEVFAHLCESASVPNPISTSASPDGSWTPSGKHRRSSSSWTAAPPTRPPARSRTITAETWHCAPRATPSCATPGAS
jgi:hypothetical protein